MTTPTPTGETYDSFTEAFAFFNRALFSNELPDVIITMQRSKRSRGYFAFERFVHRTDLAKTEDEIALNPRAFIGRTDREIISTLVHEMAHLWQFRFGNPSRRGYHNKEWASKMLEIGLVPTDTGEPGGKQTGQRVTHYIQKDGAYETNWKQLIAGGFVLNYQDRDVEEGNSRRDRQRYSCDCSCVWGKPEIDTLFCKSCQMDMRPTSPRAAVDHEHTQAFKAARQEAEAKDAKRRTQGINLNELMAEHCADCDTDEKRWQRSAEVHLSDLVALTAYWDREFKAEWRQYNRTPELLALVEAADKAWPILIGSLRAHFVVNTT